jgi:hypothetical protein
VLLIAAATGAQEAGQLVDLERLRTSGEDWEVVSVEQGPGAGMLRLHQDWWLMYFLHWRPLTEDSPELTVEYVRNLLVSFWGPGMPFTLTGREGQLTIGGHRALFVEATIYDGAVHTRFIVWNCPESGRQMIADTNVNRRTGTPVELLDLQREVTKTVCCHGQAQHYRLAALPQHFAADSYSLSFDLPRSWRAQMYLDPDWYPDGPTPTAGSVWALPTDSDKRIDLAWRTDPREPSPGVLAEYLELLRRPLPVADGCDASIGNIQLREVTETADRVVAAGHLELGYRSDERDVVRPYRFQSYLWHDGGRVFLATASMVALERFWEQDVDLVPTDEVFETFVCRRVWPALRLPNPLAVTCSGFAPYLEPTDRLDCDHPRIVAVARQLSRGRRGAEERARALFDFVRDLPAEDDHGCQGEAASRALECGSDSDLDRAVLLAALARSAGIPAGLRIQRVSVARQIGGEADETTFAHLVVALYLGEQWRLFEPAGSARTWQRWTGGPLPDGFQRVTFSPGRDCLFRPTDGVRFETLDNLYVDWSDELEAELGRVGGGLH